MIAVSCCSGSGPNVIVSPRLAEVWVVGRAHNCPHKGAGTLYPWLPSVRINTQGCYGPTAVLKRLSQDVKSWLNIALTGPREPGHNKRLGMCSVELHYTNPTSCFDLHMPHHHMSLNRECNIEVMNGLEWLSVTNQAINQVISCKEWLFIVSHCWRHCDQTETSTPDSENL